MFRAKRPATAANTAERCLMIVLKPDSAAISFFISRLPCCETGVAVWQPARPRDSIRSPALATATADRSTEATLINPLGVVETAWAIATSVSRRLPPVQRLHQRQSNYPFDRQSNHQSDYLCPRYSGNSRPLADWVQTYWSNQERDRPQHETPTQ
ncbi:MAG: hypothetical protein SNJ81_11280 [Cyanobacteriota bacterium]